MRRLALASIVMAALVTTACAVPRPPGEGLVRYRDQVFGSASVTRDVTYGNAPDLEGNNVELKLDVYQPAGDTVTRRPAFVWVHGGGFTTGDKASGQSKATYFARLGYVVVSINYRLLSPDGCGGNPDPTPVCETAALAAQHDAQAAVRFLRRYADTYGVDPDRIAIGGGSAGAVTSLLVNWRSEDPGESGHPGYPSKVRAAVSQSGGIPTNEFIDAGDSPAIFFHGTEDQTVFYHWAVSNAGAMYNAGIFTVLYPFEGAGHGLSGSHAAVMNQQSTYFLFFAMDLANAAR